VFQTKSNEVTYNSTNDSYVFENSDIRIDYNFWANQGEMYFEVHNKSSQSIFLNLDHSHLIRNGKVIDYYSETTTTVTSGTSSSKTVQNFWSIDNRYRTNTRTDATSISTKPKPVIHIPANSFYLFAFEKIIQGPASSCGAKYGANAETNQLSYNETTSPFSFRNYIEYDFSEKFEAPKSIDNKFWVEKIHFINQETYNGKSKIQEDCFKRREYVLEYPYWNTNNFYYKMTTIY